MAALDSGANSILRLGAKGPQSLLGKCFYSLRPALYGEIQIKYGIAQKPVVQTQRNICADV